MLYCERCKFWDADKKICTDTEEYINSEDGELCCRYHINAVEPVSLASRPTPDLSPFEALADEWETEKTREECDDPLMFGVYLNCAAELLTLITKMKGEKRPT